MPKQATLVYFVGILLSLAIISAGQSTPPKSTNIIQPASSLPDTTPWDLPHLSEPPQYQWSGQQSPVWSLQYQGESYQGKPTHVFAYYASPATLNGQPARAGSLPAVILVHGGGGTAFNVWAELWAKRGYAAIAMDLSGYGPDRKKLPDGGPALRDNVIFGGIDQPIPDQWPYHAVANVILAHSLIRSFPEVDANRTAITGISWGGYLTSIVAGLDNRFKAAVPVYGCGFLYENSGWLHAFEEMTPQQKSRWITLWDPSCYIGSTTIPIFFVNGTNDRFYRLDSYSKTYQLVKTNGNYRITVNMPHSHQAGWAPPEIGLFIDQYINEGLPLPIIAAPRLTNGQIKAEVQTRTTLTAATLHYTTGTIPINELTWQSIPARIENQAIIAPVPPQDAAIWFLTATDNRNATVSSKLVFSPDRKDN